MNRLWLRLAVSFLAGTLLVIGAVAWVVRGSVTSSFGAYINVSNIARFGGGIVDELEAHYAEMGSWRRVRPLLPERGAGRGEDNDAQRGVQTFIAEPDGEIVAATLPDWVGLSLEAVGASRTVDLIVDGEVVGILGEQTPGIAVLNEAEQRFLQDVTNGLILTAVSGALVSLGVGVGLSYSLTRPLHRLTRRISSWSLKDSPEPIPVGGTEEVQRLAAAFNDLLARLSDGETQRQRMSADIAHELRTPVTVMRGHLEAMMDGVYPLDVQHLAVAYDQVIHLSRLVEDLRLLTRAEAGRLPLSPSSFDLIDLIRGAYTRFAPLAADANLKLMLNLPEGAMMVYADRARIQQVLDNLIGNALRHTPAGESITIQVSPLRSPVRLIIANRTTAPLDEDALAHLFDRFWRGEDARTRDGGGSGLGLAITRELLRVQGGSITAEQDEQRLRLVVTLPAGDTALV